MEGRFYLLFGDLQGLQVVADNAQLLLELHDLPVNWQGQTK